MQNRHLIAKQVFELRVGHEHGAVPELQESFSRQYWQSIVPAFEKLFDQFAEPDELIRVDRLELDLGRWTKEDILSGKFVKNLISQLESVIKDNLRGDDGVKVNRQAVSVGNFDLWLYFLEYGYLPADTLQPETLEKWQQQILESLTAQSGSALRLRNLLLRRPKASERLLLQYDDSFLKQLLETLTDRKQDELVSMVDDVVSDIIKAITDLSGRINRVDTATSNQLQSIANTLSYLLAPLLGSVSGNQHKPELKKRIRQALEKKASNPKALAQWLIQEASWKAIVDSLVPPEVATVFGQRIIETLQQSTHLQSLAIEDAPEATLIKRNLLRQLKRSAWQSLIDEVIIKKNQANTVTLIARVIHSGALLPWRGILIRAMSEKKQSAEVDARWKQVAEVIKALPPVTGKLEKKPSPVSHDARLKPHLPNDQDDINTSKINEGDVFYIQAAGIILLHPFLNRLFEKLGLCEKGEFIDEASHQRAVCLIHYLATGEVHTPEYQLVLPKFLCGMPLNVPLDHFIEINEAEKTESENLIQAAIEHWGALGNTSPDGLRETFLLRDGKLEKRQTTWHLTVERKPWDILLDRLPWGKNMVKLPWIDELLQIDW